ncbi:hypothetical protein ACQUD0_10330 [Vagococcus fluvialis]|uniref:hypothetical protein n=1 Tax=Vagococcus fluvialis TaxID=2738 RepID=UPI003D0CC86E
MTNLSKISYKIFYCLFIPFLLWIFVLNLRVDFTANPYIILFFSFIVISFLLIKNFFLNNDFSINKSNRYSGLIELELWLLLFIVVTIIGLLLRVTPSWDYDAVHRYSLEWTKKGSIENISYFARYPNNNLVLLITTFFYKIINFFLPNSSEELFIKYSIVFNSILVTSSIYFTSQSAKVLYGNRFKYISIAFLIFFTPTLFYTEIFYTDTLGLFLVSVISYILVITLKNFNLKHSILLGIIFAFGFKIKAFIIIILIACIIVLFLKEKLKILEKFLLIFLLITTFFCSNLLLSTTMDKIIGIDEELYYEFQFPTSHWIMMSLNPEYEGGFNQDDYAETRDTNGKENKKKLINKKIEARVDNFGIDGLLKHGFLTKMKRTWTVGSMATDDYASRQNIHNTFLQDFIIIKGKKHHIYYFWSQATHLFLIFLILLSGLLSFIKRKNEIDLFNISILGLILFLIIWECNSRYLFSFIPLFLLASQYPLSTNIVQHKRKI